MRVRGLAAIRSRAGKASINKKRGFDVPEDLLEEYQHLRRSKHLTAREAGEALGLIPRTKENSNAIL